MIAGAVLGLVLGVALGVACGFALRARRAGELGAEVRALGSQAEELRIHGDVLAGELREAQTSLAARDAQLAALSAQLDAAHRLDEERAATRARELEALQGTFAELSARALDRNTEQFLSLADARLKETQTAAQGDLAHRQDAIARQLEPLRESLARYEEGLRLLELQRQDAYSRLDEQVGRLVLTNDQLQRETRNLVTALRSPQTRGRWGEVQLRRVVEMAGMVAHCDFEEQVSVISDQGRIRPDVVVHLPGNAQIVVDAKVPLDAFLRATEAQGDEERRAELVLHARQVRTHVDTLAKKEYWGQFDTSPEFVVAFVPGESLLSAAFEQDPGLIEHAMASRVVLTTPTTLIALLRTVAMGWQREDLTTNAQEVSRLGAELYDRLRVLGSHFGRLQKGLATSVEAFNDAVGSLESRVLVTARRFSELGVVGAGAKELTELAPVGTSPRSLHAPELVAASLAEEPAATRHGLALWESVAGDDPPVDGGLSEIG
jgi:DNA recombination protein RmuC